MIPPSSFHIRTCLFHHAWLMTAILDHFMLQWHWSHVKKWPKPACDIQFLIRMKSRLWAHLEQLSKSLVCDNRDFLTVQKILSDMYISGFVNTICGTKCVKCPKTSGQYDSWQREMSYDGWSSDFVRRSCEVVTIATHYTSWILWSICDQRKI